MALKEKKHKHKKRSASAAAVAPAEKKRKHKKRKIRIDVVEPHEDTSAGAIAPFLACYANGDPEGPAPKLWRFELQETAEGITPFRRRAVCHQGDGADLVVDPSAETDRPGSERCTYALAVYNPSARSLRVLPVQGGRVCRVAVQLAGAASGPQAHEEAAQRALDADAAASKAQAARLVDAFGSTRRRRQLRARDEGRVGAEQLLSTSDMQAVLDGVNAAAAAAGSTRDAVLARSAGFRNIPPHHLDAAEPQHAYVFSELVPLALARALNIGQLLAAVEGPPGGEAEQRLRDKRRVPDYVIARLCVLRGETEARARKAKARVLAALAALLQLLGAAPTLRVGSTAVAGGGGDGGGGGGVAAGLEEVARTCRIGRREVLEPLLELFYNHSHEGGVDLYQLEASKKQLLLGYALVMALNADGWVLQPPQFEALRAQLRLAPHDLVAHFRALGARCDSIAASAGGGKGYRVGLLQRSPGAVAKTLAECFPKPSLGKRPKAR